MAIFTKKPKKQKLCNMTYTDADTGQQRACRDGNPRPAAYHRAGAWVCQECYPDVCELLLKDYAGSKLLQGKGYTRTIGLQALQRTFKRVA